MRTSTIYTIGTALTRAQGTGVTVDVLVAGQWLCGHVSALDGHGLVLHRDDDVLSVLRMESIDAVQVRHAAAFEAHGEVETSRDQETAHPMPAARHDAPADAGAPDGGPPDGVAGSTVVPLPRRGAGPHLARPDAPSARPTVGPVVAPHAQPSAGLHTMLRPRREALSTGASSAS